jgi:molybdopterin-containing oxidoreductase family iron-sulfur binding subunit
MNDIDLSALRARLASSSGPAYWRSLDELAETDEFKRYVEREFPEQASEWNDPAGRRQFLKLMGASLALAGVTGCTRQPAEKILPYVVPPEGVTAGKPLLFATAMPHDGYASPVLAVSHMGRPTKIEPNPDHPAGGGTSVFSQASILDLYDPDRSQTIRYRGEIRSFTDFVNAMRGALSAQAPLQGTGLRLMTGTVTSPTLAAQIQQFLDLYPSARWVQDDPVSRDNVREGARLAFGQELEARYRLENADAILLLDADLFECGPGHLGYARAFADRRRVDDASAAMNRLYVVESRTTNTGTKADHRVAVRASDVDVVARAIAAGLGVAGASAGSLPSAVSAEWVRAVVDDLRGKGARALVVAGEHQPASVHVLAHAINAALGAVGSTVEYLPPVAVRAEGRMQTLAELTTDMAAGAVDVLIMLGGNPVYTAPADLQFAEQLQKVALRVHHGLFVDETAERCDWHVPATHYLEQWGDLRAFDGTVTICQPLIAPLYEPAKSAHEVLAALGDNPTQTTYEVVRAQWEGTFGEGTLVDADGAPYASFDKFWRKVVHDGFVPGTASTPVSAGAPAAASAPAVAGDAPQADAAAGAPAAQAAAAPAAAPALPAAPAPLAPDALEVTFSPDPTVYDGRYANNGWLQETPKPLNKMTWDNVIVVSPRTAERLGLPAQNVTRAEATLAEVVIGGRTITGPVWVQVGHPDNSINLQLGYGRRKAGRVGNAIGYDAYAVRQATAPWIASEVEVRSTGDTYQVASAQLHFSMENRHLVRTATLEHFKAEPDFAQHVTHVPKYEDTLHGNEWSYDGYKWGMVIDLNACDGCNACVVACTSENNIPVVGKQQVAVGREMHWIRVDRYYEGNLDNPTVHDQPVNCMQCENAPCEVVCPVAATVHSEEGLNDMVYNRCVGTRYCANNCPYKVRRFNFLLYADWDTPTLKMARNPEVTVRSRGVMEKCTYCVQRINSARIEAKLQDRRIADGEVKTACQTACPTQAIIFGDMNDPASQVAKAKASPRNYGLLEDLNTRPRTTYLAAVRNPNPALEPAAAHAPAGHGSETH